MSPKRPDNPLNDAKVLEHAFGTPERHALGPPEGGLPESSVWQGLCEALRAKRSTAKLLERLEVLLAEREAGAAHPTKDSYPQDDTLAPTPALAAAWRAYKAAILAKDFEAARRALEGL
jgi:hypothetical protein